MPTHNDTDAVNGWVTTECIYVVYSICMCFPPLYTCFTQHSCPSCDTCASVHSCTRATILTGTRAWSYNIVWIEEETVTPVHCAYTSSHSLNPVAYMCTEAHSHSTVHQTGRFYCLLPAECSLHHRCRSLQSCRLYWRDCVGHLWECQDHHSR